MPIIGQRTASGAGGTEQPRDRRPETGERGGALDVQMIGGEMVDSYDPGTPSVEQLRLARKRDPQMRAVSDAGALVLGGATGSLVAHENDSGEKEFLEKTFMASASEGGMTTPFADVLSQMARSGWDYGRAFFEIVVEDEGGYFVPRKVAYRKATTCKVNLDKRNGSFDGFKQSGFRPSGGSHFATVIRSENAFVYFRGAATAPLTGESAIESAYRAHVDKLKTLTLWREHLQQFALGILVGTMPSTTFRNKIKRAIFRNKTHKIRGGGRVVISEGEKLEILSAAVATDQFLHNLRYYDRQMSVSILAPFLNLGDGSVGSWALSSDQRDFFVQLLEGDLRGEESALTNHLFAKAIRWNFGPDAAYPTYKFDPLTDGQRKLAYDAFEKLQDRLPEDERALIRDEWLLAQGIDPDNLEEVREKLTEARGNIEATGGTGSGAPLELPSELTDGLSALDQALQSIGGGTGLGGAG